MAELRRQARDSYREALTIPSEQGLKGTEIAVITGPRKQRINRLLSALLSRVRPRGRRR